MTEKNCKSFPPYVVLGNDMLFNTLVNRESREQEFESRFEF